MTFEHHIFSENCLSKVVYGPMLTLYAKGKAKEKSKDARMQ